MPTNYVDNVPLQNVATDAAIGLEHGDARRQLQPDVGQRGPGCAFATLDAQWRNTDSGKAGVACMVCHSLAETRNTPYPQPTRDRAISSGYAPRPVGRSPRATPSRTIADIVDVPDAAQAQSRLRRRRRRATGSRRTRSASRSVSGPLSSPRRPPERDPYLSERLQDADGD